MRTVHTNCRICVANCGIEVRVDDDERIVRIGPDKENDYSWRDFCPKGRTANQAIEHPRRLLSPMRRVGDGYEESTWDEAIADIGRRLKTVIADGGPDAVGVYWGNPTGFSMSNAMFNAGFMDALGTHNRYSVLSVDTNSAHVVAREMFGSELVVLVPDVDDCRCFLFVGMNPAESKMVWIENVPDGWRRVLAAQEGGAELIVVDPRRTMTAEKADVHLRVRPGADWALLLGIVATIFAEGLEDAEACAELTNLDRLRRVVERVDLRDLAARCDIPEAQIRDVARRFARAPSAMCVTRTGVALTETGTLGEWLGQVLNFVTGRIGAPGGRRFEPGYFDLIKLFDRIARPLEGVSRVRGLPAIAGGHSLAELADEILTPGNGQVRAVFVNAGNPVIAGADGERLDHAFSTLDLLVCIDLVQRESHRHADWLIPAPHWLERGELNALVGGMCEVPFVQYSTQAVPPPPGVRGEWEFFVAVALEAGLPMFGKRGVNSVIRASRWLARRTGRPGLAFNPEWIERALVLSGQRLRWKDIRSRPHGWIYAEKDYDQLSRAIQNADGRVDVGPELLVTELVRVLAAGHAAPPARYPLVLGGRRRLESMNSWLNELPGLHRRSRTNSVELHPEDAETFGVVDGAVVRVSSPTGSIELPCVVTSVTKQGCVVIEHGWGSAVLDPTGEHPPERHGASRNLLTSSGIVDPLSQIAAFNTTPVRVDPVATAT